MCCSASSTAFKLGELSWVTLHIIIFAFGATPPGKVNLSEVQGDIVYSNWFPAAIPAQRVPCPYISSVLWASDAPLQKFREYSFNILPSKAL